MALTGPALSAQVVGKPEAMQRLEAIVHPLVKEEEARFFEDARSKGAAIVVLDIPLLFETGGEDRVDVTVVVSAGQDIQRERVLARPGMSVEKFEAIKQRQLSDVEKRARADYLVDTSRGLKAAEEQVDSILADLKSRFQQNGE